MMGIRSARKQRVEDLAFKFARKVREYPGDLPPEKMEDLFLGFCAAEGILRPQDKTLQFNMLVRAEEILKNDALP